MCFLGLRRRELHTVCVSGILQDLAPVRKTEIVSLANDMNGSIVQRTMRSARIYKELPVADKTSDEITG